MINTVVELRRTPASSDESKCRAMCVCLYFPLRLGRRQLSGGFLHMESFSVSFSGCFLSEDRPPIDSEAMALTASLSESRLSRRLWA